MRDAHREGQQVMGTSGWDDESSGRSRSSRDRYGDDDWSGNRSSDRARRGGSASASSYERPGRPAPRGRDDYDGRDRSRDDDWRSSGARRGSGELEGRRPRPRSSADESWDRDGSGRGRSYARDDYGDRGDRSMRGQRPPSRGDERDPNRSRGGPPGNSSGRGRVPARGGLWDDEAERSRRRRPDVSDPRSRAAGSRMHANDPRAMRRGLVSDTSAAEEDDDEKGGFSFGKALMIWLLMFAIGAGGAYGYYRFKTPVVHGEVPTVSPSPVSTASPAASPSAAPKSTASPHALAPAARPSIAYLFVSL